MAAAGAPGAKAAAVADHGARALRGGGNRQQPDLEELLKRSQDKFKQVLPGGVGAAFPAG